MNFYTHKTVLLSSLGAVVFCFFSQFCQAGRSDCSSKIDPISSRALHQMLYPHEDSLDRNYDLYVDHDTTIINVLSPAMYDDCHVPTSINIPLGQLQSAACGWNRIKKIIVYGQSCSSPEGREAYGILIDMGFRNVQLYERGMKEWRNMYPDHCEGQCSR